MTRLPGNLRAIDASGWIYIGTPMVVTASMGAPETLAPLCLLNYHCILMIQRRPSGRTSRRNLQRTMSSNNSNAERSMDRTSRPAPARRQGLATIAKVGVTFLIFAYIAHSVDFSGAWQRVAGQNLLLVALAAC